MCVGIEGPLLAQMVGAGAAVAGAATAIEARRDAKKDRGRMEAERRKGEADAANRASSRMAAQRQALRENSLFTGAGSAGSAMGAGTGRTTLGV